MISTVTLKEIPFMKPKMFLKPLALVGALLASLAFIGSTAFAQTQNVGRVPNLREFGDTYTTATNYTNATVTPTVVPGTSITNTTVYDPSILISGSVGTNSAAIVYQPELLDVWWTADVAKSTSTTGSCQIYLNGVAVARSLRTVGYAGGENEVGGFVELKYPTDPLNVGVPKETQTIALECYSADTGSFAVYRAQVHVYEVF
jgi:hypothetical protein